MAAAGSEKEVEAIFLMNHQESRMEPGAWEVTVTSPDMQAMDHSVWKKSQSPCKVIHAEYP